MSSAPCAGPSSFARFQSRCSQAHALDQHGRLAVHRIHRPLHLRPHWRAHPAAVDLAPHRPFVRLADRRRHGGAHLRSRCVRPHLRAQPALRATASDASLPAQGRLHHRRIDPYHRSLRRARPSHGRAHGKAHAERDRPLFQSRRSHRRREDSFIPPWPRRYRQLPGLSPRRFLQFVSLDDDRPLLSHHHQGVFLRRCTA